MWPQKRKFTKSIHKAFKIDYLWVISPSKWYDYLKDFLQIQRYVLTNLGRNACSMTHLLRVICGLGGCPSFHTQYNSFDSKLCSILLHKTCMTTTYSFCRRETCKMYSLLMAFCLLAFTFVTFTGIHIPKMMHLHSLKDCLTQHFTNY